MPSLADIPGLNILGAFNQARQLSMQEGASNLSQVGALQGIMQKARAEQMDMAFKAELQQLGPNPSAQQLGSLAAKYGGAEGVMRHADRMTTAANTKEAARNRLTQALQMADMVHQDRMRTIATGEQNAATNTRRAAELERHNGVVEQIQGEASQFAGGRLAISAARLKDETGIDMPQFGQQSGPVFRETAPTEADAFSRVRDLSRRGILSTVGVSGEAPPSPAPQTPLAALTPAPANNLDARDLGAGSRGPVMGTTPITPATPAPAAPAAALPPMPPEIASAPAKTQRDWQLQQTRPSIAGAGLLEPETLRMTAEQYLTGDRQAVQGYARSAPMRAALQNEIVKVAKERGMSGADIAAKMSDFAGIMAGSRSVGVRQAQIELASSEAIKMIKIVEDTAAKFDRTNFVPWNVALKAYDTGTGKPEVKAMGAAINSLVNVYARAINPVGIPTIQDKEHARELLAVIHSPEQVEAVLGILRQEMTAARAAPEDVRAALRQSIVGNFGGRRGSDSGWSIRPK